MARGPKPKPAAVKAQKAAVHSKRQAPAIGPASAGIPPVSPPDWLGDEGAKIWARLAPTLAGAKLLSSADGQTFGRYCRNFARWLKMQIRLDQDGEVYTVETASGAVHRPRPEFLIADRLERQLLAAEDRFGLNPAERQRIMAARAQSGQSGDLFSSAEPAARGKDDAAAKPAEPAQPVDSPIGLLN